MQVFDILYKVFFFSWTPCFESEVELNGFLQVLHVWSCSIEFLQSWYMLVSLYGKLGCWVSCLNNLSLGLFSEKKTNQGCFRAKGALLRGEEEIYNKMVTKCRYHGMASNYCSNLPCLVSMQGYDLKNTNRFDKYLASYCDNWVIIAQSLLN